MQISQHETKYHLIKKLSENKTKSNNPQSKQILLSYYSQNPQYRPCVQTHEHGTGGSTVQDFTNKKTQTPIMLVQQSLLLFLSTL